jgi:hypothetical protein
MAGLFKAGKAFAGEAANYFDELLPLFKDVTPAKAVQRSKAKVKSDADLEAQMRAFKGKPQSTIGATGGVSTKTTPGGLDISRAQALDEAPDWANPDLLEAPVVRTQSRADFDSNLDQTVEELTQLQNEGLSKQGAELALKFQEADDDTSDLTEIEKLFREWLAMSSEVDSPAYHLRFSEFVSDKASTRIPGTSRTSNVRDLENIGTRYDRFGNEITEPTFSENNVKVENLQVKLDEIENMIDAEIDRPVIDTNQSDDALNKLTDLKAELLKQINLLRSNN